MGTDLAPPCSVCPGRVRWRRNGGDLTKGPRLSNILLAILAVIGVFILGDLTRRMADARRLERDSRLLGTQVQALEEDQANLQTQVAQATSEGMVEEWARGEAKMVGQGEKLVVPIAPDGSQPTSTPVPSITQRSPTRWDVWWALLFGD